MLVKNNTTLGKGVSGLAESYHEAGGESNGGRGPSIITGTIPVIILQKTL